MRFWCQGHIECINEYISSIRVFVSGGAKLSFVWIVMDVDWAALSSWKELGHPDQAVLVVLSFCSLLVMSSVRGMCISHTHTYNVLRECNLRPVIKVSSVNFSYIIKVTQSYCDLRVQRAKPNLCCITCFYTITLLNDTVSAHWYVWSSDHVPSEVDYISHI